MSEAILNRLRNGLVRTTKQTSEIICLKAELTTSTDELLSTSDDARMFSDADRIDRELMACLISRKMINWCDKTCRLAPLKNDQATSVSGLLRAVVGSIWGLQDEAIESFLRRLLHVAMTTGKQQPTFKERWQQEQDTSHSEAHQSHSKDAWEDVYSAFQGNESQAEEKEDIPLDPIHIFSLSNILRRPILVLGDDSSTNSLPSSSSTSSITDLTGIYLPLLSSAESCVPYPLVLVRHEGLFRPLLVNLVSLEWWQVQTFRSVPLVRVDQEPFHIRCLLTSESRRVRDLLMSYLNIAEISYATASGTIQILTCRLSTKKPLLEGSESEDDVFANAASFRMKPFSESCIVTDEELSDEDVADVGLVDLPNGGTSGLEGLGCVRNCIACQTIKRDEQKKKLTNSRSQSESGARSVRGTYSTRCENAQCKKEGSQKFGGRCYACYVVRDPWLGVSSGDERIKDLRYMGRNEDLVCPKTQELTLVDPLKDLKITKVTDVAVRQKEDRMVETERKDNKKLIKVDHTQEPATFKHRRGSESVKDRSAREKGRHESKTVTGNGDSDTFPVSTTSANVHDSTKDIAKIDEHQKSEKPAKATGANESEVVRKTNDSISDPQPTSEHLITSGEARDLAGGSEEQQSAADHKCIVDFCNNRGETSYKGLCRTCYETLARHRRPRDQEESNVLRPVPSSIVAGVQCLMDGCEGIVTNQQLGLCLSCLRMQIFAARDLERKKEQRRSFLLKLSENQVRTTKVDASAIVPPVERSSRSNKQKPPKSPRDVHAAKVLSPPTHQGNGPALRNYSSQRTRAKCCLTAGCDRYGDPGFDGFCSLCYERLSPGLLVPRS